MTLFQNKGFDSKAPQLATNFQLNSITIAPRTAESTALAPVI
jgi:hypothetical protein